MNKILAKRQLAPNVIEYVIEAPRVVKNAKPGQFIILRVSGEGERIPFTICDMDKSGGTVTILVQTIGASTMKLAQLNVGDSIHDFVGPLGKPTDLSEFNRIVLVGGGIGSAVIFPQAKYLHSIGKKVDVIVGARNRELIMYEDEFRANCDNLLLTTDDGSYVRKGFVTDVLRERIASSVVHSDGTTSPVYDCVLAVGPMPMMRAVANLTREFSLHTMVSMNSMMVDGTGMCGCCRLTVGGVTKYACVHGPEFDAHLVDWDEAINRGKNYIEIEKEHKCKLTGEIRN